MYYSCTSDLIIAFIVHILPRFNYSRLFKLARDKYLQPLLLILLLTKSKEKNINLDELAVPICILEVETALHLLFNYPLYSSKLT